MSKKQILRIVRRVHLYTGLLFFPWVFLFGISGLLFNHPNLGEDVSGARLTGDELTRLTGLSAWDPKDMARRVVGALNAQRSDDAFLLDPEFDQQLSGVNLFAAPAANGRHLVLLDMQQGAGIVATRGARPSIERAPFANAVIELPEFTSGHLSSKLQTLLQDRGLTALGPLKPHPKIAQQLRFRLLDKDGTRWNATYNLKDGKLAGRRTDEWPNIGVNQWMGKLHTAHHFPARLGWRTLWAALEDLLGLTLTLWATSGLIMWWQLKATRVVGLVCIGTAVTVASLAMYRTSEDLLFGPVGQALGPGD